MDAIQMDIREADSVTEINDSGVYKIVNKVNGKFYIGSAINLKSRMSTHFTTLRRQVHHNKFLQRSYNKYGVENFVFQIIEYCNPEDCIEMEQKYLDALKPHYNLCKTAGSTLGRKASEETRKKFSELRKGKPIHTEEWKKAAAERGRLRVISDETRAKMSESAKNRDLSQAIKNVSKYQKPGSINPRALLNEEQVKEIKLALLEGICMKRLAKEFNVPVWNIYGINKNQTWKHVVV